MVRLAISPTSQDSSSSMSVSCRPNNGDIFRAQIADGTINVYLNKNDGRGDQLIVTGEDPTYTDGGPGLGFFIEGGVDLTQFGFAIFSASSD
jgi:hypothetical protein